MGIIYITYDNGIPQLACDICGSCDSIIGKSLCGIMKRGCCHYFPEFFLAEIHRMLHLEGGKEALDSILGCPGTTINNFSINSKGVFYKEFYDKYIEEGQLLDTGAIQDHTIFFRTCPFVKEGVGCIFPVRFRTTVCNFFICAEILEKPELNDEFNEYLEERTRYSRWIHRESKDLQHILTENGLNLILDFKGSIKLMSELPLSAYEFPLLKPVEFQIICTHC